MIEFLVIWSVFGFISCLFMTPNKNKKKVIIQLILCGPLCWMIFLPFTIKE